MAQKRRPKYIEELVETVNYEMWNLRMKYDESNRLFFTVQEYLIKHGWYRGFNFYHDELRTDQYGFPQTVHVLHGSDQGYEYIQLW